MTYTNNIFLVKPTVNERQHERGRARCPSRIMAPPRATKQEDETGPKQPNPREQSKGAVQKSYRGEQSWRAVLENNPGDGERLAKGTVKPHPNKMNEKVD